jgi:hypothetical protein
MVQRKWITNDPIFSPSNTSLSCNTPGTPARAYIPIRAGENLTAVYAYWVHTVGPMIAWMAYCDNADNDCSTFDSSTASWFKIGQKGLLDGSIETGDWFQKQFSRWDGSPSLWSETVPKGLRKGKYLVRHEIISLHSANKPQFYPECAHLDVDGEGDLVPTEEYLVRIPGVWSMDRKLSCMLGYGSLMANHWQNLGSILIFMTRRCPRKRYVHGCFGISCYANLS